MPSAISGSAISSATGHICLLGSTLYSPSSLVSYAKPKLVRPSHTRHHRQQRNSSTQPKRQRFSNARRSGSDVSDSNSADATSAVDMSSYDRASSSTPNERQ